jgi:branched-chain amino acid transport system substrate-binding protein
MKAKAWFALCLVAVLVVVSGAGCGGGKEKTIKIGMVNPLSGNAATYGVSTKNGMELAMEEINKAGGVEGRKFELVFEDDAGDPKQAAAATQKLVDRPDILLIQGSALSSSTLAMAPIIERARIPHMVVSSSTPKLRGINPYFLRMAVQDDQVGTQIGEVITKKLALKRVAIMYPNNDYGKGLSAATSLSVKANGGEVVAMLPYLPTDPDFSALITQVKAQNPDALALCGTYTDSGLITKQAREAGLNVPIVGGTGLFSPKYIEIAGRAAEGVILMAVFFPGNPDPRVQEFVKKYQAKYGMLPDQFAALAYDQMYVIAQAVKKVGKNLTRESLLKALKETRYSGVTGEVTFDEKGDWVRPYLTLTVKDGKFELWSR